MATLSSSQWQLQPALSQYLEESGPVASKDQGKSSSGSSLFITPKNTPATPPNFSDTLNMFSSLSTSGLIIIH